MAYATIQPAELQAQRAFRALLAALSYPGRPQALPAGGRAAFAAIGAALLDLETSFCSPDGALAEELAFSGARPAPPAEARYQFYPTLRERALEAVGTAPIGTYSYPDESATLVLGCALGNGRRLTLRGPGIRGAIAIAVGALPDGFWELRGRTIRYPLGWDLFLVSDDQVVGLPRTTLVEVS